MPFKETPEGQTHYYGDGCGEPEHNTMKKIAIDYKGKHFTITDADRAAALTVIVYFFESCDIFEK